MAFDAEEITSAAPSGNLDLAVDPKLAWRWHTATAFLLMSTAPAAEMCCVPGFGTRTVQRIPGGARRSGCCAITICCASGH